MKPLEVERPVQQSWAWSKNNDWASIPQL